MKYWLFYILAIIALLVLMKKGIAGIGESIIIMFAMILILAAIVLAVILFISLFKKLLEKIKGGSI